MGGLQKGQNLDYVIFEWSLIIPKLKPIRKHILILFAPAISNGVSMIFITSMGKIHTGNVHSSVNHIHQEVSGFRGRSNGADYARKPNSGSSAENIQARQVVHCGFAIVRSIFNTFFNIAISFLFAF